MTAESLGPFSSQNERGSGDAVQVAKYLKHRDHVPKS